MEDVQPSFDMRERNPPRRDTISVAHKPRPEDKKWHGHAPRPLPETDRNFRPETIKF